MLDSIDQQRRKNCAVCGHELRMHQTGACSPDSVVCSCKLTTAQIIDDAVSIVKARFRAHRYEAHRYDDAE